jgi:hypothetical protein
VNVEEDSMPSSCVVVRLVAIVLLVLSVAGCTGVGAGVSAAPTGGASNRTAPTASAAPSEPVATLEPTGSALAEPPAANMAAEGGDPVAGSLGSFTWGDGGSDSPWLAGAPIAVGVREPLSVAVAGAVPVKDWTAKRVATGVTDATATVPIGSGGAAPITFTAPSAGDWSVQVVITFGDGLGSATYYWHVTVT